MMKTELHTIKTMGNKELPRGSVIALNIGRVPGTVTIELRLKGQLRPTTFPDLAIQDGTVVLPVPLVFLCHANEDKETVASLSDRLWQDGFMTWFDQKDLLPGDNWTAVIEDTIEQSDRVIVFLSKTSILKTGYVQREIKYALEQRQLRPHGQRYIIPALIEECQLPREFRDIHWLQMWGDGWYNKLKMALSGEEVPGAGGAAVTLDTYDSSSIRDPAEVCRNAARLLSENDVTGWIRMLRSVRAAYPPAMRAWRKEREGSVAHGEEEWFRVLDSAASTAEPLIALAMSMMQANRPIGAEVLDLLDDLVKIREWSRGGSVMAIETPDALAYLWHHLVGAYLVYLGRQTDALKLLSKKVRCVQEIEASAIWENSRLMGYVRALNGDCVVTWKYFRAFSGSRVWISEFFHEGEALEDCYRGYCVLASMLECASLIADGRSDRFVADAEYSAAVPPMFLVPFQQNGTQIHDIVARVFSSDTTINEIAAVADCDVKKLRELWADWYRNWRRFLSNIPQFRFFARRLSTADVPKLPG